MKKTHFIIFALVLASAACAKQPAAQSPAAPDVTQAMTDLYSHQMQVGSTGLKVQIAKTPFEMQQGLSDRETLGQDQGMLFDFGRKTFPSFWMKDMRFALDLVWISDGKIAGITPNVPAPLSASESLPTYQPPGQIDSVLEVNAGWTKQNRIAVGDAAVLAK